MQNCLWMFRTPWAQCSSNLANEYWTCLGINLPSTCLCLSFVLLHTYLWMFRTPWTRCSGSSTNKSCTCLSVNLPFACLGVSFALLQTCLWMFRTPWARYSDSSANSLAHGLGQLKLMLKQFGESSCPCFKTSWVWSSSK